ncbi:hypothetical protein [Streptomyces profundus]|uniref:hypothetical protein n=1 Tax=Streptomyces profundus TaxID=2867410 RepID=UPI002ADE5559|nr:hypothetical protein [Streptomyces sp. MA3_2.13]
MSEEVAPGARHVRVRVEMVLEIAEPDELISAAWSRIEGDTLMPAEEREQAARAVSRDEAEAVAYLIDPVDLVGEVPGVVLAQASWSSERAAFDPDLAWDEPDDALDDDGLDDDAPDEGLDDGYESDDTYDDPRRPGAYRPDTYEDELDDEGLDEDGFDRNGQDPRGEGRAHERDLFEDGLDHEELADLAGDPIEPPRGVGELNAGDEGGESRR